jgi:hypothetical protein
MICDIEEIVDSGRSAKEWDGAIAASSQILIPEIEWILKLVSENHCYITLRYHQIYHRAG